MAEVLDRPKVRAVLHPGQYTTARREYLCEAPKCDRSIVPGVSFYLTERGGRFCACCAEEAP